jgi:hypothetical protein
MADSFRVRDGTGKTIDLFMSIDSMVAVPEAELLVPKAAIGQKGTPA